MRLAVIVPLGERCDRQAAERALASLSALQPWRRRGHRIVAAGDPGAAGDAVAALVDRVVFAPRGWSRQANAGSRAPEAEVADALVFLPPGVLPPPLGDRRILQALANATSPWGRFDIRYRPARGAAALVHAADAALANAGSRLTGICTRDQLIFVTRGAYLALDGYAPIDPQADGAADAYADMEFCRRARLLGTPIALHATAQVPAAAPAGRLRRLRAIAQREGRRLALALGLDAPAARAPGLRGR